MTTPAAGTWTLAWTEPWDYPSGALPAPWFGSGYQVVADALDSLVYPTSGGLARALRPCGSTDHAVVAHLKASPEGQGYITGVTVRYVDAQNNLGAELVHTTATTSPLGLVESKAVLYQRVAGVDTELASINMPLQYDPQRYVLRCEAVGDQLRMLLDGAEVAVRTLSAPTMAATGAGTAVGLVNFLVGTTNVFRVDAETWTATVVDPPPDPEPPAVHPEVALLRRLVGDTTEPLRYTDAELTAALDAAPSCPVPLEGGLPALGVTPARDTYGVAAALWEDRALLELAADPAVEAPARVTSERNGDLAATYAGPGKLTGPAVLTPDRMLAMARQLRRRSCNAGAQTVEVLTQHGRRELPWRGTDLYPSQIVNLP